ncbi:asparagine synthase (glutamine-hydrolyzing) [Paramaledivibacter caminithermalis]|jgi:asparagine synthase (glutamine-hydrolysing)|uniref:asparagine synthase (glutamine-hydrolyzing) n=1 Tax=Paramaledivibacter caminithermalis (strain DSM 15212 / CIP 107654 / DViRD3) TaxID=1121301 RepID=A0A1M6PQW1_PARC5|nr:asparagine synthase (glutamine-hydrolyzing) [Paramaledivibacter caminithermalis]SHK10333.1 asparagine synthase (glutamine-hydrolysing) [Paramaledivibacter caminithermalis DSM 15212]
MCGICGIYNFEKDMKIDKTILINMNKVMAHRGPDGSDYYLDGFVGLGHIRLSIIDLEYGNQPMCNEDESVWVTFNGEIYNFEEIKIELKAKGHKFITNCDTEVIVHSYEEYGTDCVLKFNGMFAFAIWDKKKEILFLARDRMGIKPLYYSISSGNIIFASEIKAILQHPDIKAELEVNSIPEYFFSTILLDGKTMFKNIYSLPAGYTLVFKNKSKFLNQYWDIEIREAEGTHYYNQYKEKILNLFKDSVKKRLMSDVPFGSLLSGGLDSSLVSAVATEYVNNKLKTFSMEYSDNSGLNNSNSDIKYSRIMAKTFKTKHKEFLLKTEEYNDILENVIWHVEKPIELTTPSLYLLYRNLKDDITVVLSGEGADELFGGYFFFLNQDNQLTEFPWAPYYNEVSMLFEPEIEKETHFTKKISTTLHDMMNRFDTNDYLNRKLYLFLKLYLLEMLERQDKTSMAWSVEARVPFLDHRLVEYVANVPSNYKVRNDVEKFILKEIAREILPTEVVNRKKKPCPFPIDPKTIYVRKNIANDLVQSSSSKISQYFNKKAVNDFFNKKNRFKNIDNLAIFRTSYALISLEAWHKTFGV